jgi:hypothetical protein
VFGADRKRSAGRRLKLERYIGECFEHQNVGRDGRRVANYLLAHWSGGPGPDLIYESEGHAGFYVNGGTIAGWTNKYVDDIHAPPVPLDARAHLIDFDCKGSPALIGAKPDAAGKLNWLAYRYSKTNGWQLETNPDFKPRFPASTNPEAVREIRFGSSSKSCAGLIVATAEGTGLHKAFAPDPQKGWIELEQKAPRFELVDAMGNSSRAIIADLRGDGYQGVFANTQLPTGPNLTFAWAQNATGWDDVHLNFVPTSPVASNDPKSPAASLYVGPLVGQGGDDIVILNDARILKGDSPDERSKKFGRIFTNDGTKFMEQAEFAPPVVFGRQDKQDLGVRFVDLHGTGLPDVIFSRVVTTNGKTKLISGAFRNTGQGWLPESDSCGNDSFDYGADDPPMLGGLCPPVAFAGDDITGNPIQFVDLDGDGYLDMIYSYKNKAGKVITKFYFNVDGDHGGRKWSDYQSDPRADTLTNFIPPKEIFPIASFGIGDLGIRFTKFDTNRMGVMIGFRSAGPQMCAGFGGCWYAPGQFTSKAFTFDGTQWQEAKKYAPPVPFVTQYDSNSGPSGNLFVQIIDVIGAGLPAIVASYTDPATTQNPNATPLPVVNHVWTNNGNGWDGANAIKVPYALDAIRSEPKTLVQLADVNGDGLPDIVMTKGDCPGQKPGDCSKTWLGTGNGWVESPNWRVPSEAVSGRDGDPGFRLVDTKGDGYLDVLWMRQKDDGTFDKGLRLNNGHDWSTAAPDSVVPDLSFTDAKGVDQGVRLLSLTGKGLTDIIKSFAGSQQVVQLNRSRRADVLESVTDGYGLKTTVFYETLLEVDGSDSESGVAAGGPLGSRPYERGMVALYPIVAPVPTTYVVRKAVVDEGDNRSIVLDYRYGKYRIDSSAARSLGFGWRESLNEASGILSHSELLQDARARPGVTGETTCFVQADVLKAWPTNHKDTPFPSNLCPAGAQVTFDWGHKLSERGNCWTIAEGDISGLVNDVQLPLSPDCGPAIKRGSLSGFIFRQAAVTKTRSVNYEVDGRAVSSSTDSFNYDTGEELRYRPGNVVSTTSTLDDGTSIETNNEYSDDLPRWFLGRLTKTVVTKRGDIIEGAKRKIETRCTRFDYDGVTGLLAGQELNCGSQNPITTKFARDRYGNILTKAYPGLRRSAAHKSSGV